MLCFKCIKRQHSSPIPKFRHNFELSPRWVNQHSKGLPGPGSHQSRNLSRHLPAPGQLLQAKLSCNEQGTASLLLENTILEDDFTAGMLPLLTRAIDSNVSFDFPESICNRPPNLDDIIVITQLTEDSEGPCLYCLFSGGGGFLNLRKHAKINAPLMIISVFYLNG